MSSQRLITVGCLMFSAMMSGIASAGEPAPDGIDAAQLFPGVKPEVEINLTAPLIKMVAAAADESVKATGVPGSPAGTAKAEGKPGDAAASRAAEEGLVSLANQLELIQVRVFDNLNPEKDNPIEVAHKLTKSLNDKAWTPILAVPEDDEIVESFMRVENGKITDLVSFVAEKDEFVFIHGSGQIDPESFGRTLARCMLSFAGTKGVPDIAGILEMVKGGQAKAKDGKEPEGKASSAPAPAAQPPANQTTQSPAPAAPPVAEAPKAPNGQ